jgi:acyl-coenzyme A thioesterase PaaI-like protein
MTTISQTTNFMRPLQGDIKATAAVIKAGRSTVFGEIQVGLIGSADAAVIASSIFAFLPTSP